MTFNQRIKKNPKKIIRGELFVIKSHIFSSLPEQSSSSQPEAAASVACHRHRKVH